MSYSGDWELHLLELKETLESVLQQINEDYAAEVRADVSALNAFDSLNQYLEATKREFGIL